MDLIKLNFGHFWPFLANLGLLGPSLAIFLGYFNFSRHELSFDMLVVSVPSFAKIAILAQNR